jgi:hypothetical protein
MCLGYPDYALKQFQQFLKLVPNDQLIPLIIKAFSSTSAAKPRPAPQTEP